MESVLVPARASALLTMRLQAQTRTELHPSLKRAQRQQADDNHRREAAKPPPAFTARGMGEHTLDHATLTTRLGVRAFPLAKLGIACSCDPLSALRVCVVGQLVCKTRTPLPGHCGLPGTEGNGLRAAHAAGNPRGQINDVIGGQRGRIALAATRAALGAPSSRASLR